MLVAITLIAKLKFFKAVSGIILMFVRRFIVSRDVKLSGRLDLI